MAENQTVEERGLKVLSAEMTSQEVEMNWGMKGMEVRWKVGTQ